MLHYKEPKKKKLSVFILLADIFTLIRQVRCQFRHFLS